MPTHISKNTLHFNHLKIYRHESVPRMDEGRNGDIILVDTKLTENDPTSVGLWMKLPLTDMRAVRGTVVIGQPGAISTFDTITINTVVVTFTNKNDRDTITDDINTASIPNITAYCLGDVIELIEESGGAITVSENSLGLYSSLPLADLNTNGVWAPLQISGTSTYSTNAAQLFIESPEVKSYTVLDFAVFQFTIKSITTKTNSGTADITLQINGENAGGLPTITAGNTRTTTISASDGIVHMGDNVTIVVSNISGAADLSIMITYKYRSA